MTRFDVDPTAEAVTLADNCDAVASELEYHMRQMAEQQTTEIWGAVEAIGRAAKLIRAFEFATIQALQDAGDGEVTP